MTGSFDDPLAQALWECRREHRTLDMSEDSVAGLSLDRARAIASELYLRLDAVRSGSWKLGAFDRMTRELLGLAEPLVAPVPSDRLSVGPSALSFSMGSFVQAKLEAEVGVAIYDWGVRLVPCIEVADCRFLGWRVPAAAALADFGLQGAMAFGPEFDPVGEVRVDVRHDGQQVGSGRLAWDEAIERLTLLPPEASHRPTYVATGAITPQLDASRGRWEFEFRDIATMSLNLS